MVKVGIIGGMGPQASAFLYKRIIEIAGEKFFSVKNSDYPKFHLVNLPVPDQIKGADDLDKCLDMINDVIADFYRIGIDRYFIACNTIHLYRDKFMDCRGMELIGLPEIVKSELTCGLDYLVFGGKNTVRSHLYGAHIAISDEDLIEIGKYIDFVIAGEVDAQTVSDFENLVLNLSRKYGSKNLLIACTELPILFDQLELESDFKLVNCTDVLAERICREVLL